MSTFLDINVIQSVPASCINRDDTNTPKTVIYGGALRSRVSSQAWKHAMRDMFNQETNESEILRAHRTKHIPMLVAKEMQKQDTNVTEQEALDKICAMLKAIKIKFDTKKNEEPTTKTLLMLSVGQIRNLAKFANEHSIDEVTSKDAVNAIKNLMTTTNSADLALFGRMVAGDENLNVDAATQVAHAFSVNEIQPEFDYFIGSDDDSSSTGAAMIDSNGFNSSTLYRYANLNLTELKHNLGGDKDLIDLAAKHFIKDFIMSMPTGKENAYANKTLPNYVLITVRDDTPVNLASAFEKPIVSRTGFIEPAINALETEFEKSNKFVEKPRYVGVVSTTNSELAQEESLNDLIKNALMKSNVTD